MDSYELRQMSLNNAKLALNQTKGNGMSNRLERIEPFALSPSQRSLLRKMRWWFETQGMRKFQVKLHWGQKDTLSYTGISWSHYIDAYVDRDGYGEVAKWVLNELRELWIEEVKGK